MSGRLTVGILAAAEDLSVARQIHEHLLDAEAVSVVPIEPAAPPDRVVVVLSASAVGDSRFLAAVEEYAGSRLVPVAVASFATEGLPAGLADLNWILWNAIEPEHSLESIASAVRTQTGTYNSSRSLEAKAWAWASSNEDPAELLDSVRRWRAARDAVRDLPLVSTSAHPVRAFLAASEVHARKLRRRRWGRRAIALLLVGAVALGAFDLFRTALRQRQLHLLEQAVTSGDALLMERPEVQAPKVAALMLHHVADGEVDPDLRALLETLLAQPWPEVVIGQTTEMSANAVALHSGGTRAWIASGSGRLVDIDLATLTATDEVDLGAPVYSVVATADGRTALATTATEGSVSLLRAGELTSLPSAASAVALSDDGTTAVLVDGLRTEVWDIADGTPVKVRSDGWDEVLDVQARGEAALWILARDGSDLVLLDARSGEEEWRDRFAVDQFVTASVARAGAVVVATRGQLWFTAGSDALRATGHYTPDVVGALEVDSRGIVYGYASETGPFRYDTTRDLPLPPVCREAVGYESLRLTVDESMLLCESPGSHSVWDTAPGSAADTASQDRSRRSLAELVGEVRSRLLPCYPGTIREILADDQIDALGVRICDGGGL